MVNQPSPWSEFLDGWTWNQGEHITIVGPTNQGKTTLALQLLPRREFVCVLAAKPQDELIERLGKRDFVVVRKLPFPPPEMYKRVIFWPRVDSPTDIIAQKEAFRLALIDIYRKGGYCLYIDELRYVTDFLRLAPLVDLLWQQGRSLGVSVVGGTQRPAFVPLAAYDQATHLFLFRDNDAVNLRRLRGIGGVRSDEVAQVVPRLEGHRVLYLNTRDGRMQVTEAEPPR
jgi:hypothetical protein